MTFFDLAYAQWGALVYQITPAVAGLRSQIHQPVRIPDYINVMLNHDNRMSLFDKGMPNP